MILERESPPLLGAELVSRPSVAKMKRGRKRSMTQRLAPGDWRNRPHGDLIDAGERSDTASNRASPRSHGHRTGRSPRSELSRDTNSLARREWMELRAMEELISAYLSLTEGHGTQGHGDQSGSVLEDVLGMCSDDGSRLFVLTRALVLQVVEMSGGDVLEALDLADLHEDLNPQGTLTMTYHDSRVYFLDDSPICRVVAIPTKKALLAVAGRREQQHSLSIREDGNDNENGDNGGGGGDGNGAAPDKAQPQKQGQGQGQGQEQPQGEEGAAPLLHKVEVSEVGLRELADTLGCRFLVDDQSAQAQVVRVGVLSVAEQFVSSPDASLVVSYRESVRDQPRRCEASLLHSNQDSVFVCTRTPDSLWYVRYSAAESASVVGVLYSNGREHGKVKLPIPLLAVSPGHNENELFMVARLASDAYPHVRLMRFSIHPVCVPEVLERSSGPGEHWQRERYGMRTLGSFLLVSGAVSISKLHGHSVAVMCDEQVSVVTAEHDCAIMEELFSFWDQTNLGLRSIATRKRLQESTAKLRVAEAVRDGKKRKYRVHYDKARRERAKLEAIHRQGSEMDAQQARALRQTGEEMRDAQAEYEKALAEMGRAKAELEQIQGSLAQEEGMIQASRTWATQQTTVLLGVPEKVARIAEISDPTTWSDLVMHKSAPSMLELILRQKTLQTSLPLPMADFLDLVLTYSPPHMQRERVEVVLQWFVSAIKAHNRTQMSSGSEIAVGWTPQPNLEGNLSTQLVRLFAAHPQAFRYFIENTPLLRLEHEDEQKVLSGGLDDDAQAATRSKKRRLVTRGADETYRVGLWSSESPADQCVPAPPTLGAFLVPFPQPDVQLMLESDDTQAFPNDILHAVVKEDRQEFMSGIVMQSIVENRWAAFGRRGHLLLSLAYAGYLLVVVLLSSLDPAHPTAYGRGVCFVMVALTFANAMEEMREIYYLRSWSMYVGDVFNLIDWLRLLAADACVAMYFMGEVQWFNGIASGVVYLQWVGVLQMLKPFRTTGALVHMVLEITHDIKYFLLLILIAMLAVTNSFYVICRDRPLEPGGDNEGAMAFSDQGKGLYTVFNMVVLGDFLDAREYVSDSVHEWLFRAVFVLSMFFVMVVLLNLLIAIMSDSFERIQEAAENEFRLLRASAVLTQQAHLPGHARVQQFVRWYYVSRQKRLAAWKAFRSGTGKALLWYLGRALLACLAYPWVVFFESLGFGGTPNDPLTPKEIFQRYIHILLPKSTNSADVEVVTMWQGVLRELRREIRAVDVEQPLAEVRATMHEHHAETTRLLKKQHGKSELSQELKAELKALVSQALREGGEQGVVSPSPRQEGAEGGGAEQLPQLQVSFNDGDN